MVRLKRMFEHRYEFILESKKDQEELKAYLGDGLYDDYMDVRKKLPDLKKKYPEYTLDQLDTERERQKLQDKFNSLIPLVPDDIKRDYPTHISDISDNNVKRILSAYLKLREIAIKNHENYKDFSKLKKLPIKDIEEFINTYQSISDKRKTDKSEGATKLYEDKDWVVYKITSYPAAQYYGSGTKWCITGRFPGHEGRGQEYFNSYIDRYNLDNGYYFYINKKNPNEKYCLLKEKSGKIHSIWDAPDTNRGSTYFDLGFSLPEVKGIDLPKFDLTALKIAVDSDDIDTLERYLTKGFTVNDAKGYEDLLCYATEKNRTEFVDLLLDAGFDPNVRDDLGNAPLHYANNLKIAKILVDSGADVNIKNKNGDTPLLRSVVKDQSELVNFLLDNGANPNISDKNGDTPLHYVRDLNTAKALVSSGANINSTNNGGESTLVWPVIGRKLDIARFLLDNGADPNIHDKNGDTPLYWATKQRNQDAIDLLKKYGAEE